MKKLLTTGALLLCSLLTSFAQFSGSGSGTADNPYKIFYKDEFNELRNCLNQEGVYYILMNDLDLSEDDWLSNNYPTQGWQPVGSTSAPFKGILDGNGKTISGFSITRTSSDYVGLFGAVEGATIKNLTLKGDIKGKAYVGSLFGSGSATVTNYTFEGTVTGTGDYVGGVGGSQSTASSTITVHATVKGVSYTGGIYGKGAGLTSASFTSQVTGTSYVGGLEGQGSGTFSSCTVVAPVTGTSSCVGGLVGYANAAITFRNNCIQQGNVRGTTSIGGLVGNAQSSFTATNCSQEGDITGSTSGSVGGLAGFVKSSFTATNCSQKGRITGNGDSVGGLVGYAYSLTANTCSQEGIITGGKYVGGLVGHTEISSTVSTATNCSQEGDITGTGNYVGGLVGCVGPFTVSYYNHEGSVSGQQYTGGSVGYASGTITLGNCTQRGNVSGTTQTGGIIGYSGSGAVTLTSCFAEGDITGSTYVGGICGQIQDPGTSSISACNFWGNISGTSQLGGVIGAITLTSPDFTATTTAGYKKGTSSENYNKTACFYNTSTPFFYKNSSSSYYSVYLENIASISEWEKVTHNIYSYHSGDFGPCTNTSAIYQVYNNIKNASASANLNVNILNCSAVGDINGTGTYIGGIVGQDISGNSVCYPLSQSKTVYYYKGDGVNTTTTPLTLKKYDQSYIASNITESYFSGNLTGTDYIGGIAGTKRNGRINNCYASGSISGRQYVGGIAGSLSKESENTNENSLNANASICTSIIGTSDVGKIYGATDGNFSVGAYGTNSENRIVPNMQFIINGIGQAHTDGEQNGTEVGISVLRRRASYFAWGWNLNDYWKIIDTESFPYKTWQAAPPTITGNLVANSTSITGNSVDGGTVYIKIGSGNWQSVTCSGTTFTLSGITPLQAGTVVQIYAKTSGKEASYINQYTVDNPGSGTEADPWKVYSANDLQGVYKAGYYKQMNDIDLTSWISANSASAGWVPVGYNGTDPVIYDGDNHKITGLWTNRTSDYTGLFSNFTQGTIRNLTVEVKTGKQVKGGNFTGIVIGRIGGGTIENVTATGNVSASNYAGGITGHIGGGTIENVTATSNVSASSYVGGIAGYTTGTILKQLSYTGQLTATGAAGGITSNCNTSTTVTDCEAKDIIIQVTGSGNSFNVGGLVGNPSSTPFDNCKVSGTITVTGSSSGIKVGGLVATNSTTITKCATNVTVSSASLQGLTAGLVAQNSGTIRQCSAAGTVTSTGTDSNAGGLVANAQASSVIEDCYSTANATGVQYTAGLVAYNYGKVRRCYASGNVSSTYYGAGLVGYNDGASAVVTNCVALGSKVEVSDQTGWGIRVIGGYKNGAPDPDESNYAWSGMQISVNGVPKRIQDNILDGQSLSDTQIKQQSTYESLSWDFTNVWRMPANGYPVLQWQPATPEVMKGDLNGDGRVRINDVVMIIDVIADPITYADMKDAADVNNDGNVRIDDCVAAIDLIAAQGSAPSQARKKVHTMLSDTDFITGAMENNLLTVSLDNEKRYTAFQMIVSVPEGMTLGEATMDEMRGAKHLAVVRDLGGGQYLVAGFSTYNKELTGSSGRLLSIVTNGQATDDIVISDIEFVTTQAEAYYLPDIAFSSTIATGINEMKNEESRMKDEIYDLQGRRVMNPTKGMYIVNGKKVNLK